MIIQSLKDRQIGDTVFIAGTGYKLIRIVGTDAYAARLGTAGSKTYMLRPEGNLFTVSELKGDRVTPWTYVGAMHYLKPVDLFPGLE